MSKMKYGLLAATIMMIAGLAHAEDAGAGGAAPLTPEASEGAQCVDEGTLSDMQAAKPFICGEGKWHKVVFKGDAEGSTAPFFYEGIRLHLTRLKHDA